ncbi:hypothetical protein [Tatumella sp. UCD-D_suzukii]|uniref:hypothetical protein n=1 Tax=Tatumella sp. UCD-D_suzukii TaxID=1408192 RepID=UPI00047043BC|nr:hypothetical protein [Tatumella sp. UCD-D_suzukii]
MSLGANECAAIASAAASLGSVAVSVITYRQQSENNKQAELDKLTDRLIALASRANSYKNIQDKWLRSFNDAADLVYAIDSAAFRIQSVSRKYKLDKAQTKDLKSYFINYLSYQIVEEMRLKDMPTFEIDASYGIDDFDHICFLWKRGVGYLMFDKEMYRA